MKEIRGDAKSVRALLSGAKFAIDYYQREYRWETKHVAELIEDLAEQFVESHEPGNERSAVENYGHYFLGSIIISDKDGHKFIIDGQQRLTSLTLLLIHIYRQLDDEEQKAQLADLTAFARLIQEDFAFYTHWYERIRRAAETLTKGLEAIHFNAQNNFTLQYPVLLAPLRRDDSESEILCKLHIIATYLDILIARRVWNWKATDYSTMQYNMFQLVILKIRGKSTPELATFLTGRLAAEEETFASNDRFRLHGMNGKQIHRLLARMTDYVETRSGRASRYAEYIQRRGKNGYEVEHIWANHPERHADEFVHPTDFADYRNRIGGLLLLPKSFNASYGDKP